MTGSERGERDVFRVYFARNQLMLKGFPATAPACADAGMARAKVEAWPPKPAAPNQRRDAGGYWVVDGTERIVSLNEFASECGSMARQLCAHERAKMFRQFVVSVKQAVARAATAFRPGTPAAHA